jgi:colicin import membrane protein
MTKPLEAMPVESIAVDLISIEEFSNIRKGTLDSTIVETPTPSIVDDEQPAEVAQPTGNTEEDQPTPEDTEVVTPAPTQETAPEPVPEDEPAPLVEPEPEPEPEVVPEPVPEPEEVVEEPEPVAPAPELATPVEPEEPTEVAPQPMMRTASLDEKRKAFKQEEEQRKKREEEAEAKRKKELEEERIREAKRQEDEAARIADEVANIINSEQSRGATTGAGGEASLGKESGQAARLSQSQMDALVAQIRDCMSVPMGAAEAGVTTQLSFKIDGSGVVRALPAITRQPSTTLEQALASAAQRAVMRCGPYLIAVNQEVLATFDPRLF